MRIRWLELNGDIISQLGKEIGKEISKEVGRGLVKEVPRLLKELGRSKGFRSEVYFTFFKPRIAREDEFIEIIRELVSNIGEIEEPTGVSLARKIVVNIGKSKFQLEILVTKLNDVLFYEKLYNELIDVMQGGTEYTATMADDELIDELGIERASLEDIVDATLVIYPEEKVRPDDLYTLIKTLYDRVPRDLGTERAVVKIRISAKDNKALNSIYKKLSSLNISMYRGENNLTVVLHSPPQILDEEVYKVIFS